MAANDPEIFTQLIADMDEERLYQFISEQEQHDHQMQNQNFNILSLPDYQNDQHLHSDMGLNQMQFVDPSYVNEQKAAYDAYKKPSSAAPKKRQ